jgi:hypothetical protein
VLSNTRNNALKISVTYVSEQSVTHVSGLYTLWARSRHPCRSRSESKVPHTLCYVRNHSAMVSKRCNPTPASAKRHAYMSETTVLKFTYIDEGVWSLFQDRTRQEVEFAPPWMGSRHVLKQRPRHPGAHADKLTQCTIETRRFSATAPAWLYHLHPCVIHRANLRGTVPAHPCARGVPFILNITVQNLNLRIRDIN